MTDSSPPYPLRIRNLNYAGFQFFLGFVVGPLLIGMIIATMVIMLNVGPEHKPERQDWIWFSILGVPGVIGGVILLHHGVTAPVFWLELGEQIRYRKTNGLHTCEWSEVHEIRLEEEESKYKGISIGTHRILVLTVNKGGKLRVKVDPDCEFEIYLLAKHNGITLQGF